MPVATTVTGRAKAMWLMKLHAAFRTALACTIVGCTTLYGPACLRTTITFPAFSYLTTILIVSDANLGDAIRGCWHAFYATLQVVPLSMLSLWIIGHHRFSPSIAALTVALTSFFVGLLPCTHLMSKRIAFGQIVIVYVDAVIHKNHSKSHVIMLPLHVASSTALGAASAFLALLLPYPQLAYSEIRRLCRLYAENVSERMNLYFRALNDDSYFDAADLIYQAKPLAATGNKLLQSIALMQDGIRWERPWIIFSKRDYGSLEDRLLGIETPVRGMEIALSFCHLPARLANQERNNDLLEKARCFLAFNFKSMPVQELKGEFVEKLIFPHETILPADNDKSAGFFMYCAQHCINDFTTRQNSETLKDPQEHAFISMKEIYENWIPKLNKERLLFASKCSLSLGLAVLIGLIFSRENGYWSGLTIAISFVDGRQAIFTAANARAQGTAIGSVYGVLGCFIFEKLSNLRFVALLPWIIFTSFLRHSQMYGRAGGISAVIGALLILGRNNYGPPKEFAIDRLTEATIGLCAYILVELPLQPTRASTLAKKHLNLSLVTLQECIKQMVLSLNGNDQLQKKFQAFRNEQRNLKSHIHDLQHSTAEAEMEPNFWFLPFRGPCYQKLQDSMSNMAVLLLCITYSLEFLLQESKNQFGHWKELQEHIDIDLDLCKKILSTSLSYLEKATFSKSFQEVQELQGEKIFPDQENGNLPQKIFASLNWENENSQSIAISFLPQITNAADNMRDAEGGKELKEKMVFSLSTLGFCIGCLVRELKDTERGIKELMYWENP